MAVGPDRRSLPARLRSWAWRWPLFVFGVLLSTLCYAVTIRAALGLGPLYAFQDGIARHTGMSIGDAGDGDRGRLYRGGPVHAHLTGGGHRSPTRSSRALPQLGAPPRAGHPRLGPAAGGRGGRHRPHGPGRCLHLPGGPRASPPTTRSCWACTGSPGGRWPRCASGMELTMLVSGWALGGADRDRHRHHRPADRPGAPVLDQVLGGLPAGPGTGRTAPAPVEPHAHTPLGGAGGDGRAGLASRPPPWRRPASHPSPTSRQGGTGGRRATRARRGDRAVGRSAVAVGGPARARALR